MANSMTTFKWACYRLRLKLPVTQSQTKEQELKIETFPWLADCIRGNYCPEVFGLLNAVTLTTIFGMRCRVFVWFTFD